MTDRPGMLLGREVTLEPVTLAQQVNQDGQGRPVYGPSYTRAGRVSRKPRMVLNADGAEINADLTVWFPGETTEVPRVQDRIGPVFGEYFVVIQSKPVRAFDGTLVHTRVAATRG